MERAVSDESWPLWSQAHPDPSAESILCPHCGQPVAAFASYCEACGHSLVPRSKPPADSHQPPTVSVQTQRLGARVSPATQCASCGGTIAADGYCQTCGTKAPSARDHYSFAPSSTVAGICDRGQRHVRNEDALAVWADDHTAILVVCDGVSTSTDPDLAAVAAANAAAEVLSSALAGTVSALDPDQYARLFVQASSTANDAVIAVGQPGQVSAPSATLAAAVVCGNEVHFANLGDSRVYLIGETSARLLSVDDSMAQEFIASGMDRAQAESLPNAHAITKWLGSDAEQVVPRTGSVSCLEPAWVVVCSDGLWNYVSEPDDLATLLHGFASLQARAPDLAQCLVTWANERGGKDNITVALAWCPGRDQPSNLDDNPTDSTSEVEVRDEHG